MQVSAAVGKEEATKTQLNRLLDCGLALPPESRARWLASLDGSHARLRPQLDSLLARSASTSMSGFLATLPKFLHAAEATQDPTRTHAGPYKLLEQIGSGGMGTVWLAEKIDGTVNRQVALKLPRGLWPQHGLAERLTRERDILAVLNHRHIARLYDAGVTQDGQPYLALEHVVGKPIDLYCSQHDVDLRTRLRLFLQIAEAVAHAHAKLIVHRDLKPANILVTEDGHVRLLDFGIAKLIEREAADSNLTEMCARPLTLTYAAPEQIAGEPVSIACDIYSLGVVLYELIAGVLPLQSSSDSRRALEHSVLHDDPVRPSERIGERSLRRVVRGDLDAIILKALRKEPELRYATANAFAEDIVRFLSSRPVTARRDTAWYRFRKLIHRNRAASAALATLFAVIAVVGLIAVDIAQSVLKDRERIMIIKDMFAGLFQEIDRGDSEGISIRALERILVDASAEGKGTLDPTDMLAVRIESRLAVVEHRLGKEQQAHRRLQSALDALEANQMQATAEYARVKLNEASLAIADERWLAAEEALERSALATMISHDERKLIDSERHALHERIAAHTRKRGDDLQPR